MRARLTLLLSLVLVAACTKPAPEPPADAAAEAEAGAEAGADAEADAGADAGADAATEAGADADTDAGRSRAPRYWEALSDEPRCPPDMVRVARRYCVDRYEVSLVDAETGEELSPYYVPERKTALGLEKFWDKERLNVGPADAREIGLPPLPPWQKRREFEPKAVSRKGRVPAGYLTGPLAALACKNAGKRLCSLEEWRTACRGEDDLQFPYGEKYEQGKCNIFREAHPAMLLHDNASIGHSDPRLNLVKAGDKPLLRRTGETRSCYSKWEGDRIADMVGNIDEWIDDPEGTFVGGFYARSKKDGCDSMVRAHPFDYFDYSTGTRCCMDLPR